MQKSPGITFSQMGRGRETAEVGQPDNCLLTLSAVPEALNLQKYLLFRPGDFCRGLQRLLRLGKWIAETSWLVCG
jgi:hypothetical protein